MSELESLASHVSELGSKVDFWNSMVLWALFITALAAAAIVFSQRMAFVRARQLADTQEKINRIKEAEAKATQQRVEFDLAKQQERAANAEKDLLKLQAQMNPRTLTTEQITQLLSNLRASPKGVVRVACVSGVSPEPCTFAKALARIFIEGGWTVTAINEDLYAFTVVGLHLAGHDDETTRLHGEILAKAIRSIGFPVKVRFDSEWIKSEPELVFTVGLKP